MHTDREKKIAYTVLDIHISPNISIYIHVLSYKLKDFFLSLNIVSRTMYVAILCAAFLKWKWTLKLLISNVEFATIFSIKEQHQHCQASAHLPSC